MKKTSITILITGLLFSATALTTLHAAESSYDGTSIVFDEHLYNAEMMKVMDTDKDGKVSKDEYMKMSANMASKKFMMMDMNDDGFLSNIEYQLNSKDS